MAYAGIAGLPPQAGLYTLVVSLVIYALMGTSRHLSVGPTSATSALLASVGVGGGDRHGRGCRRPEDLPGPRGGVRAGHRAGVPRAPGLLKLGFITQFLSKPVMDGFVMGLAVFVAVGQLNKLFGVPKPEGNTVQKFFGIIRELPEANWAAFAIGVGALVAAVRAAQGEPEAPGRAGRAVRGRSWSATGWTWRAPTTSRWSGPCPQGLPSLTFTADPAR